MSHADEKPQEARKKPLWSDAAAARLERVPAGPIREMALKAVNTIALQSGVDEITEEFVGQILDVFQSGSTQVTETLPWDEEARAGISRAPDMVRGMLVQEIERWAASHGKDRITAETVNRVKTAWMEKGAFHLNPGDPRAIQEENKD